MVSTESAVFDPRESKVVELRRDPTLLMVPLCDGQVLSVFAHSWETDRDRTRFFADVVADNRLGRIEMGDFPNKLLAEPDVLKAALFDGGALASPPGTKTISAPQYVRPWEVDTSLGCTFTIWTTMWALQGPYEQWGIIVQGWPMDSRSVFVPVLRFPVSLLPTDVEYRTARNW